MSNPAPLSRQEMLGSSGKCLNHFCIIYSRYLASSTGNEFSIWKRVTGCPRQEINLRSLSLKTDLGPLNTPNHFLHRIIAAAASWTCFSFTHSSPLLRQVQSPSILQDSSKSHIFLILGTASPMLYINIVLCTFWSALADIISLNLVECCLGVFFISTHLLSYRTELSFPTTEVKAAYLLCVKRTLFYLQTSRSCPLLSLFFFFFLAVPCGMWDLSSLTRDQTCAPCMGSVES